MFQCCVPDFQAALREGKDMWTTIYGGTQHIV